MRWVGILFCALFGILAAPAGGQVYADDSSPDLKKILRDWEFRRKQTRSLYYRLTGRGVIPKGTFVGLYDLPPELKGRKFPTTDYSFDTTVVLSIDFVKHLARSELQREMFDTSKAIFTPYHKIKLYDGERVKARSPRETNTSDKAPLSEAQPDLWEDIGHRNFFAHQAFPLFFAHGRFFRGEPDPTKLDDSLDPALFRGVGFGEHEGRRCAIVRATVDERSRRVDEFWVDESRRSAVVRWVHYPSAKPIFNSNVRYPVNPAALWPESCDWTWYNTGKGSVRSSYSLKVVDFKLNPDLQPGDFRAEPTPGTVVSKKDGFFKVNDDRSLTRFVFDDEKPKPASGWWSSRWAIVSIVGVVVAAGLGVFLWRRRALGRKP